MKLEVGMYVRFKDKKGATYIRKLTKLANEYPQKLYGMEIDEEANYSPYLSLKNILKASNNIIDLIEVGDLIEHEKIGIKQIKDKDKYNQYIWYSKNHNPSTCDIEDAITFEAFNSEFEVGNISIVTKEQFENIKYSLGG
jgi:hypothetical protein